MLFCFVYFVSSPLIHDVSGLTSPQFKPPTPLDVDSVYYWRYAKSSGGPYGDHSRAFAAQIVTGCCQDRVGDANGLGGDEPTIGDVSTMIDALFIGGDPVVIACLTEADVNQSGGLDPQPDDITIGDISTLIDYLFITGPSLGLAECL